MLLTCLAVFEVTAKVFTQNSMIQYKTEDDSVAEFQAEDNAYLFAVRVKKIEFF